MSTREILNEREKTHGDFDRVAETWVRLINIVDDNISSDNCGQIAGVYMILLKIARIVCGDPDHADHWDDIAGYAMLGKGKAKGVFGAGEPCKCPNKRREYFADTADGFKTIMTVDYCDECNKMHIVDCEQEKAETLTHIPSFNEGVDAASEYYESILDDFKNKWIDPKKALPPQNLKVNILCEGKVIKDAICQPCFHTYQFKFKGETQEWLYSVDIIDGWRYSSKEDLHKDAILFNARLKDIEEIKAKESTSSKMEHEKEKFISRCHSCNYELGHSSKYYRYCGKDYCGDCWGLFH